MTARPTHQTVRIGRGAHRSADEGACVVELSSMLAGEPFSDRPDCVCPVVAGFLRAINDRVPYATRQRLYPYAARAVGTRGGREVERARRDLCLAHAGVDLPSRRGRLARWSALLGARLRIAMLMGLAPAVSLTEGAGIYAARRLVARDDVDGALALLDAMMGDDMTPHAPPVARPSAGDGSGRAPVAA